MIGERAAWFCQACGAVHPCLRAAHACLPACLPSALRPPPCPLPLPSCLPLVRARSWWGITFVKAAQLMGEKLYMDTARRIHGHMQVR